eukprot:6194660-Pleurochrysis_carterae.AAC.4
MCLRSRGYLLERARMSVGLCMGLMRERECSRGLGTRVRNRAVVLVSESYAAVRARAKTRQGEMSVCVCENRCAYQHV